MAATDLADYLVGKGMPFRQAHEVVGELVLACEKENRTLQSLTPAELARHSEAFGPDATQAVDIEQVVARRNTAGGTGHEVVRTQLGHARTALDEDSQTLSGLVA